MKADHPDVEITGAHEFGTTAITFGLDGRELVSGGYHGDMRFWDVREKKTLATANGHDKAIRAIVPLDARTYASGGDDGRIVLWRNHSVVVQVQDEPVTALAVFQGRLVSGHADHTLRLWSTDTLKAVGEITLEADVVALSARSDRLAVGTEHQIVVFDKSFKPIKSLATSGSPHDLQLSPDGKTLAAGSWFRLHVWDVASGEMRSIPTEHNGLLTSVAYSPDSKQLVSLGRHTDSAIRIYDTHDFSVLRRFEAHELCGAMIRFSPDGTWLASASDDESVRLYDLRKR